MDTIRVSIRVRPSLGSDKDHNEWCWTPDTIYTNTTTKDRVSSSFTFDRVFSPGDDTGVVYTEFGRPIILQAMEGFNGTIFAYGQTGTGKTHTMIGNSKQPGVIPRSMYDVFNFINEHPDREFLLRASYIEIYNEEITDLLNPANTNLKIRNNIHNDIYVENLVEVHITDPQMALAVIERGEKGRHYGETKMNGRSSRSHAIFTMIIESKRRVLNDSGHQELLNDDEGVNVARLNLVDLAGSERAGQTGAKGTRLKESGFINKSLLTLGSVISKLSTDGNNAFIPYRDSKITRILQNSLGGNAKTSIICTASSFVLEETASTLKFASRAKCITNHARINEVFDGDDAKLISCRREIKDLRRLIAEQDQAVSAARDVEKEKEQFMILLEQSELKQTEQQKKIEYLNNLIITAAPVITRPRKQSERKLRRETWCPGSSTFAVPKRISINDIQEESLVNDYQADNSISIPQTPDFKIKEGSDPYFLRMLNQEEERRGLSTNHFSLDSSNAKSESSMEDYEADSSSQDHKSSQEKDDLLKTLKEQVVCLEGELLQSEDECCSLKKMLEDFKTKVPALDQQEVETEGCLAIKVQELEEELKDKAQSCIELQEQLDDVTRTWNEKLEVMLSMKEAEWEMEKECLMIAKEHAEERLHKLQHSLETEMNLETKAEHNGSPIQFNNTDECLDNLELQKKLIVLENELKMMKEERANYHVPKEIKINSDLKDKLEEIELEFDSKKDEWSAEKPSLDTELIRLQKLEKEFDEYGARDNIPKSILEFKDKFVELELEFNIKKEEWFVERSSLVEAKQSADSGINKINHLEVNLREKTDLCIRLQAELDEIGGKENDLKDVANSSVMKDKFEEIELEFSIKKEEWFAEKSSLVEAKELACTELRKLQNDLHEKTELCARLQAELDEISGKENDSKDVANSSVMKEKFEEIELEFSLKKGEWFAEKSSLVEAKEIVCTELSKLQNDLHEKTELCARLQAELDEISCKENDLKDVANSSVMKEKFVEIELEFSIKKEEWFAEKSFLVEAKEIACTELSKLQNDLHEKTELCARLQAEFDEINGKENDLKDVANSSVMKEKFEEIELELSIKKEEWFTEKSSLVEAKEIACTELSKLQNDLHEKTELCARLQAEFDEINGKENDLKDVPNSSVMKEKFEEIELELSIKKEEWFAEKSSLVEAKEIVCTELSKLQNDLHEKTELCARLQAERDEISGKENDLKDVANSSVMKDKFEEIELEFSIKKEEWFAEKSSLVEAKELACTELRKLQNDLHEKTELCARLQAELDEVSCKENDLKDVANSSVMKEKFVEIELEFSIKKEEWFAEKSFLVEAKEIACTELSKLQNDLHEKTELCARLQAEFDEINGKENDLKDVANSSVMKEKFEEIELELSIKKEEWFAEKSSLVEAKEIACTELSKLQNDLHEKTELCARLQAELDEISCKENDLKDVANSSVMKEKFVEIELELSIKKEEWFAEKSSLVEAKEIACTELSKLQNDLHEKTELCARLQAELDEISCKENDLKDVANSSVMKEKFEEIELELSIKKEEWFTEKSSLVEAKEIACTELSKLQNDLHEKTELCARLQAERDEISGKEIDLKDVANSSEMKDKFEEIELEFSIKKEEWFAEKSSLVEAKEIVCTELSKLQNDLHEKTELCARLQAERDEISGKENDLKDVANSSEVKDKFEEIELEFSIKKEEWFAEKSSLVEAKEIACTELSKLQNDLNEKTELCARLQTELDEITADISYLGNKRDTSNSEMCAPKPDKSYGTETYELLEKLCQLEDENRELLCQKQSVIDQRKSMKDDMQIHCDGLIKQHNMKLKDVEQEKKECLAELIELRKENDSLVLKMQFIELECHKLTDEKLKSIKTQVSGAVKNHLEFCKNNYLTKTLMNSKCTDQTIDCSNCDTIKYELDILESLLETARLAVVNKNKEIDEVRSTSMEDYNLFKKDFDNFENEIDKLTEDKEKLSKELDIKSNELILAKKEYESHLAHQFDKNQFEELKELKLDNDKLRATLQQTQTENGELKDKKLESVANEISDTIRLTVIQKNIDDVDEVKAELNQLAAEKEELVTKLRQDRINNDLLTDEKMKLIETQMSDILKDHVLFCKTNFLTRTLMKGNYSEQSGDSSICDKIQHELGNVKSLLETARLAVINKNKEIDEVKATSMEDYNLFKKDFEDFETEIDKLTEDKEKLSKELDNAKTKKEHESSLVQQTRTQSKELNQLAAEKEALVTKLRQDRINNDLLTDEKMKLIETQMSDILKDHALFCKTNFLTRTLMKGSYSEQSGDSSICDKIQHELGNVKSLLETARLAVINKNKEIDEVKATSMEDYNLFKKDFEDFETEIDKLTEDKEKLSKELDNAKAKKEYESSLIQQHRTQSKELNQLAAEKEALVTKLRQDRINNDLLTDEKMKLIETQMSDILKDHILFCKTNFLTRTLMKGNYSEQSGDSSICDKIQHELGNVKSLLETARLAVINKNKEIDEVKATSMEDYNLFKKDFEDLETEINKLTNDKDKLLKELDNKSDELIMAKKEYESSLAQQNKSQFEDEITSLKQELKQKRDNYMILERENLSLEIKCDELKKQGLDNQTFYKDKINGLKHIIRRLEQSNNANTTIQMSGGEEQRAATTTRENQSKSVAETTIIFSLKNELFILEKKNQELKSKLEFSEGEKRKMDYITCDLESRLNSAEFKLRSFTKTKPPSERKRLQPHTENSRPKIERSIEHDEPLPRKPVASFLNVNTDDDQKKDIPAECNQQ